MEVSFLDLREREIINVYNGKKLGRVIDVVFNNINGVVLGIVVPGNKKIFKRSDDVFIPLEKIKRIGSDVILVGVQQEDFYQREKYRNDSDKKLKSYENSYGYYGLKRNNNQKRRNSLTNSGIYYKNSDGSDKMNKAQVSFVRLKPIKKNKYQ